LNGVPEGAHRAIDRACGERSLHDPLVAYDRISGLTRAACLMINDDCEVPWQRYRF
jgi:hypothetical protein